MKLPRGRKIHFVIMNNLFPAHRDIHETFDLKGSTVGREYPEELAAQKPRAVLKDLNWINRGRSLDLGPEKRALMTEQLRRDSDFLKRIDVMDYSLLVGIHNMQRGNRDNVRRNTLKVFSVGGFFSIGFVDLSDSFTRSPTCHVFAANRLLSRAADHPRRLLCGGLCENLTRRGSVQKRSRCQRRIRVIDSPSSSTRMKVVFEQLMRRMVLWIQFITLGLSIS